MQLADDSGSGGGGGGGESSGSSWKTATASTINRGSRIKLTDEPGLVEAIRGVRTVLEMSSGKRSHCGMLGKVTNVDTDGTCKVGAMLQCVRRQTRGIFLG